MNEKETAYFDLVKSILGVKSSVFPIPFKKEMLDFFFTRRLLRLK